MKDRSPLRSNFRVWRCCDVTAKCFSSPVVMGNCVLDHERVTRTFPEGTGTIELVAIYEVPKDRIANAWFIFGAKVMDTKP